MACPVAPVVAWRAEDLKEFTDELIGAVEASRVESFSDKARKAQIPAAVVKEIAADSKFPRASKSGLEMSVPRVAAKWLNKTGVSAENKEEAVLIGSIAAIFLQGRRLASKLDELVKAAKATSTSARPAAPSPALTPGTP